MRLLFKMAVEMKYVSHLFTKTICLPNWAGALYTSRDLGRSGCPPNRWGPSLMIIEARAQLGAQLLMSSGAAGDVRVEKRGSFSCRARR